LVVITTTLETRLLFLKVRVWTRLPLASVSSAIVDSLLEALAGVTVSVLVLVVVVVVVATVLLVAVFVLAVLLPSAHPAMSAASVKAQKLAINFIRKIFRPPVVGLTVSVRLSSQALCQVGKLSKRWTKKERCARDCEQSIRFNARGVY
jgi:hypothetical protein